MIETNETIIYDLNLREMIDFKFLLLLVTALAVSIVVEAMVLPRIIYIAKKKRLFDLPDYRKSHATPIPRLGGITFALVAVFVFSASITLYDLVTGINLFDNLPLVSRRILGLMGGAILLFGLGVKDDLIGCSYKHKLVVQFIAGALLVSGDIYVNNLYGLFGIHELPIWIGAPFSILLVMFVTNAVNLIDGADGLASGLAGIAFFAFSILFYIKGLLIYSLLSIILIGILIPFFYYNVFQTSRKLFMGDTGSLTLGFILAFFAIRFAMYVPEDMVKFDSPVIISLMCVFVPVSDALRVMISRGLDNKALFKPDRRHIHHILLDQGFTHKKVMLTLVTSNAILIGATSFLLHYINVNALFLGIILVWLTAISLLNKRLKLKKASKLQVVRNDSLEEEAEEKLSASFLAEEYVMLGKEVHISNYKKVHIK